MKKIKLTDDNIKKLKLIWKLDKQISKKSISYAAKSMPSCQEEFNLIFSLSFFLLIAYHLGSSIDVLSKKIK